MKRPLPILFLCAVSFAAVPMATAGEAATTAAVKTAAGQPSGALADLLRSMDPTADPCQDFYRYACGGWLAETERPADQVRWVRSFSVIRERNREVVRDLLADAAAHPERSPADAKIGHYFASCMDDAKVDAAGAGPLAPYLAKIAAVKSAADALRVTAALNRITVDPLFGAAVFPDFKNPGVNIAIFLQGGLGMPDRDYYVSDDEKKKELMAGYEKHVARMLALLGAEADRAAAGAAAVVGFETRLAEASRPATEMRQIEKLYHKLDRKGLKELTPELPWDDYFELLGYPAVTDINVATPEFFTALEKELLAADPELLRSYLTWQLVDQTADLLSGPFVEADFDFFGQQLSGQEEIEPRWKRCVAATEGALGEMVGQLYVERRFAGDSKRIATEMIGDIQAAFEGSLPGLGWMDDTTRERALDKAKAVVDKIGYPDEWRDYSKLTVVAGDYFANAAAGRTFAFEFEADKIGKPVDKKEWGMTPQQVNAYYNPLYNEIVFPAGILQPPFFEDDYPAAMNYGAIGAVIGHELTHGFDDSGRKFAPDGELREWWEPAAVERFEQRAQCVRDLYSSYQVAPGVQVQGDLTIGENIADIGGLKQAHAAYELWESRHGEPELGVDLTPEQVLFVAFGQVWCSQATEAYERLQVTTDSHSPARFRVIGPVSNNPAFATAFSCPAGAPMAPKQRCEVW